MIIICILMAYFSIFLAVPLHLVLVKIKQIKDCMNEEKWSGYFGGLSKRNYKKKIVMLVGFPLVLCSFVNYFCLCRKYEKKQAAFISSLIFIYFAFVRAIKLTGYSDEIKDRIRKIKKTAVEDE